MFKISFSSVISVWKCKWCAVCW